MITIERLLTLTSTKSVSLDACGGRSISDFGKEDALGVLAKVQHEYEVGTLVLECKIAGCAIAKKQLALALSLSFQSQKIPAGIAKGLAEQVLRETCSINHCLKCRGTGVTISKRYGAAECNVCHGVGHVPKTELALISELAVLTQIVITAEVYRKYLYDPYMSHIDMIFQAESDAARYAAKLIRDVDLEQTEQTELCA